MARCSDLGPAVRFGRGAGDGGITGWGQAGGGAGQGDDLRVALDGQQAGAGGAARGEQQGAVGQVLQDDGLDGVLVDPLGALRGAPARAVGGGVGLFLAAPVLAGPGAPAGVRLVP